MIVLLVIAVVLVLGVLATYARVGSSSVDSDSTEYSVPTPE
jgi:flagellar basal body-associated protein FliL